MFCSGTGGAFSITCRLPKPKSRHWPDCGSVRALCERAHAGAVINPEQVHLALPADHRLVGDTPVNLADLADSRWIAGCPRCRGHLLDLCGDAGYTPNIVFETDDCIAIQALAARGLGAALITDLMLSVVRVPGLHLQRCTPASTRITSVASTRSLSHVPAVREMVNALQRCTERMTH